MFQTQELLLTANSVDKHNCAVYVRNLCKQYGNSPPTLNQYEMTVTKGTIYGLLGSSGCGKTTILSCIVGANLWDSGELLVLGQKPGTRKARGLRKKLGYMPQDIAMNDQLSVKETLQFYGLLYNMPATVVKQRWKFLKSLLEFPENLGLIRNMSGGQRRRASMALALLHNPELLILDEPTVGLDPLLRQKIWSYLHKIVKTQNSTIIITTHYIEEARYADKIGVLRNGQLIAEDFPANLLKLYKCELMEQVVAKLCHQNEAKLKNKLVKTSASLQKSLTQGQTPWTQAAINSSLAFANCANQLIRFQSAKYFDCGKGDTSFSISSGADINQHAVWEKSQPSSSRFWEMCQRVYGFSTVTTLTLIRHPVFLVALMLMPTIQCSLGVATLGPRIRNIRFGVVNQDVTNWTTECSAIKNIGTSCNSKALSCGYLNMLREDNLLIFNDCQSEQLALEQVQLGKSRGYLSIPTNYSQHILDLGMERRFASNETLEGSKISVRLDHSDFITTFFVLKQLYQKYLEHTQMLIESCGMSKAEIEIPLHFRTPVYSDGSESFMEYMLPGNIILSLCTLSGILSAILFITDYKQGTLARNRIAGLTITDFILTQLITQSVVTIVQIGVLTAVNIFVFGLTIRGSVILYLLFCFLTGVFATSFGLFLGIVCREEVQVFVICIFLFSLFITLGGTNLPVEGAPWFFQQLGYLIPVRVPSAALRSVTLRQLGLSHPLVWPGVVNYGVWIIVLSLASILICKMLRI